MSRISPTMQYDPTAPFDNLVARDQNGVVSRVVVYCLA